MSRGNGKSKGAKNRKNGALRARRNPVDPIPEPLSDTDPRVVGRIVSQLTGRPRGKRERQVLGDGTPRGQRS